MFGKSSCILITAYMAERAVDRIYFYFSRNSFIKLYKNLCAQQMWCSTFECTLKSQKKKF